MQDQLEGIVQEGPEITPFPSVSLATALERLGRKMREEEKLLPEFRPEIRTEYDRVSVERCQQMKAKADADDSYTMLCVFGEKVFYVEDDQGRMPGHIYTELGMTEFKQSHLCEFHFDKYTKEPEEDADPNG